MRGGWGVGGKGVLSWKMGDTGRWVGLLGRSL